MQESLGISISNRVIKYAKVTKNNDLLDVASFGVKFYDNLEKDLQQIISETNSKNIPICIDTQNEKVNYFSIFSLLSKADTKKTIGTEYETLCADNHMNPNAYEGRYLIVNDVNNKDRNRVIYFTESKTDLEERTAWLGNQRVSSMSPLPASLCNIVETKKGENIMIVNIEEKTTVTTILNQRIYSIDTISSGMGEVLEKINEKENSYSKSYEACKNTTIYTMETTTTDDPNNKYLSMIVPTLFNIVQEVKKIKDIYARVDKIYLTGLGTVINNIDLYFQEYLVDIKCEILKPDFIQTTYKDTNIKEYVEVNSAISLALQQIEPAIKGINFKTSQLKDKLNVNIELFPSKKGGSSGDGKVRKSTSSKLSLDSFKTEMTKTEFSTLRICIALLIFIIVYIVFSKILLAQIEDKQLEVKSLTSSIQNEIMRVMTDTSKINSKSTEYSTLIEQLNTINNKISEVNENRDLIPNLLNQIMTVIDESVQITSISNPTGKHIVIEAQSPKYPGLGYFKRKLQINGILNNVVSGSGMKKGDFVTVTIEGDLP